MSGVFLNVKELLISPFQSALKCFCSWCTHMYSFTNTDRWQNWVQ